MAVAKRNVIVIKAKEGIDKMKFRSANINEAGKIYARFMIMPGFWALTNRWQNFQYLLIGENSAMLIDSGYGEGNIREAVEEITGKPVIVVNTHGHYDHTGGNGWWQEARMAHEGAEIARNAFSPVHEQWRKAQPHRDYRINSIKDGDIFDLGGREIEVIAIPAHHESSLAFLDKKARVLFSGDELEGGQVILFARSRNILREELLTAHKNNMQKLKSRRNEFDFICPSHNSIMLYPDKYLDDFIQLADGILNGKIPPMPDSAGFGFSPDPAGFNMAFKDLAPFERYEFGEASFVFQK
ncbi:MAG: MBL fold metallo-hydrolase [Clostridiales bacterium]|jgi:glyoxylase-like metal-dependent hydrolase (beta-lactamase superfamily II)|nr:MBL fold metallo-hydrolase [Clostridiales bacterium]